MLHLSGLTAGFRPQTHPFSDLASKTLCRHYLDQSGKKKRFLKIHCEFAYFSFLLTYLELKWEIRLYTPVVPRKLFPIADQNGQSLYPFSDQNGAKTLPFGAAHTYMAYTGEYPPPPPGRLPVSHNIKGWGGFRLFYWKIMGRVPRLMGTPVKKRLCRKVPEIVFIT